MDITKRIEKVKEYFIKFNIEEGAITLALKFPTKWTIPDAEFLKTQYNVVAGVTPYGVIYVDWNKDEKTCNLEIPAEIEAEIHVPEEYHLNLERIEKE